MKKLIMVLTLALVLGACSNTKSDTAERMANAKTQNEAWWETAGEAGTENWWISSYDDKSE